MTMRDEIPDGVPEEMEIEAESEGQIRARPIRVGSDQQNKVVVLVTQDREGQDVYYHLPIISALHLSHGIEAHALLLLTPNQPPPSHRGDDQEPRGPRLLLP